jgi:2,4-dienoyl-CoA reductase-like NADH-dependent reductase (Old Yellow Enzyme family)
MTQTPAQILAQPLKLSAETLPNRLAKAAMTEGLADKAGRATPGLAKLYERWAAGGAGLLISGNVVIDRAHRERPGNVLIEGPLDRDAKAGLAAWAKAARAHGAGFWMQINHAGRQTQATVNPNPSAPSAVPLGLPGKNFGPPREMTEAEIEQVIARFGIAALEAREAGFTGVQVHAAHGYLLSQFLSPRSNVRTDAWGGSLENRARLLLAVVGAVRREAGRDFTLSVKLNSADFQKGGFDAADSLIVARWLAEAGVDVLEISGGTYEQPRMAGMDGIEPVEPQTKLPASTKAREAYFLDFASALRAQSPMPLMVTGGFRTAAAMAEAVAEEGVALIGLARPLIMQPDAPAQLLFGAAEIERREDMLRLAPKWMGEWLGPNSSNTLIKSLNGFGALYWYYQQLRRIGAGRAPDPGLSLLSALGAEQGDQAQLL